MSYIPPHLRVSQASKPKPAATPAVSEPTKIMPSYIPPPLRGLISHQHTPASSSATPHPHLAISASSDVIYRFIVLLDHRHFSCQHVKFTRFEGDTYSHLQHYQLYTLTPDLDHPCQQQNSTEIADQEQFQRNPADVIATTWKQDLKEVLEKFARFSRGEGRDRVLPVILLRFGEILFHDRRGFFHWASSHTPENLKRDVEARRLSKTFGNLASKKAAFVRELACMDALHIQLEDKFTIQVEDEMKPGSDLWCTCYLRSEPNEKSANPGKMDDLSENTGSAKPFLEVIKVTFLPVRHMIGDVACVGKRCDIRLAFIMEEYPPLTETELCDLKSCFNNVSMNDTTLRLRMHSTSGRFKVVRRSHEVMKVVTNGGLKWYFHDSQQAYVEPILCQDFFQGLKEWNTEKAILCVEELLQRVWADCII